LLRASDAELLVLLSMLLPFSEVLEVVDVAVDINSTCLPEDGFDVRACRCAGDLLARVAKLGWGP
jgi:hypothetical protein